MEKKELIIFEGPICCPTGICGPSTDPVMIDLNETLKKLGDEYKGLKIIRASMSFNVDMFMHNQEIRNMIKANGVEILPITVVDGKIIKKQEYPKYAELVHILKSDG